jgi:glycosyltransferase involved in cell wall biosynthesis
VKTSRVEILVLPREDTNPYQELLYSEMRRHGARIAYLGQLTPSQTLNLLLLPLELALGRLRGARLVHLHWVYAFGLPRADFSAAIRLAAEAWYVTCLWVMRLLGLRLAWTAHNVLPQSPTFGDDIRARRRLAAAADLVIAHSVATLDQLADLGIVPRRSVVIPHGPFTAAVDTAERDAPGRDGSGPRELLFFGKVRRYKGVDTLLEAFLALRPELDAHLTVAGECGDPALAAELTGLAGRSAGRVTLRLQWFSDAEASPLLHRADVAVLPFREITTSGSAMLALGHGLPLVVPDLPGLAGLPDAALVRYNGTARGLGDALTDVITADRAVLAKMSAAAREYCAATGWDEIADRTLRELTALLEPTTSR